MPPIKVGKEIVIALIIPIKMLVYGANVLLMIVTV